MLIFSDLIDMALVIYVWCCLYMRSGIEKKTRSAYFNAGLVLMVMLVVDQCWQIVYLSYSIPRQTQQWILNFLTSVIYMLIPLIYVNMLQMGKARWAPLKRHAAQLIMLVFIALPAVNMAHPILFYHDRRLELQYYPLNTVLAVAEVLYFTFLLREYCRMNFTADHRDNVLVIFVIVIVSLGQAAELMQKDLSTTWDSMTLAYLLMYLAMKNLYEKTDAVTGLCNRSSYLERISRLKKSRFTAVQFDMNHLKEYNDTRGHQCGDAYLRAFAQTLRKALRPHGQMFRTGGDEFILLSEAPPEDLRNALQELSVRKYCDPEFGDFPLNFAYGMAVRERGETVEETVKRADRQMYEMKNRMHAESDSQ